jgi:probable rRNA maturation factor
VKLTLAAQTGRAQAPFVRRHLRRAATLLRCPLRDVTVIFVGDRQMSQLHKQFLNLPGPTDVLTFPLDSDAAEIYVCIPQAARQSRRRGIPLAHEVLLYALHGLLHLCGFDDRTDPQYRRMHRKEDQILTQLGIGKVFASSSPSPLGTPGGEGRGEGGRLARSRMYRKKPKQ